MAMLNNIIHKTKFLRENLVDNMIIVNGHD